MRSWLGAIDDDASGRAALTSAHAVPVRSTRAAMIPSSITGS